MSETKNPINVQIGQRIKQARKMAGFATAAQLLEKIKDWGTGRLGNYEAGISQPSPEDILKIATLTHTSPCWIMFGLGPIRSNNRDVQAIRHQNLSHLVDQMTQKRGTLTRFLKAIGISKHKLQQYLDNPFLTLPDKIARLCEAHCRYPTHWMDEQHVETDPLFLSFPEDMRTLMTLYSNFSENERQKLLAIAEILSNSPS